jgi:hypothetical protein
LTHKNNVVKKWYPRPYLEVLEFLAESENAFERVRGRNPAQLVGLHSLPGVRLVRTIPAVIN